MSEVPTANREQTERWQTILGEAEERYGSGALFVYYRRQQKQFVAMTLADAMTICGEFIVDEEPELLWSTLDKWHAMAGALEEKSPSRLEGARELGRNVLKERGVMVDDDDRDTPA